MRLSSLNILANMDRQGFSQKLWLQNIYETIFKTNCSEMSWEPRVILIKHSANHLEWWLHFENISLFADNSQKQACSCHKICHKILPSSSSEALLIVTAEFSEHWMKGTTHSQWSSIDRGDLERVNTDLCYIYSIVVGPWILPCSVLSQALRPLNLRVLLLQ